MGSEMCIRDRNSTLQAPLAARAGMQADAALEKRAYAKVFWRLVPFLMLCYVVAYLDRVNVGFAKRAARTPWRKRAFQAPRQPACLLGRPEAPGVLNSLGDPVDEELTRASCPRAFASLFVRSSYKYAESRPIRVNPQSYTSFLSSSI